MPSIPIGIGNVHTLLSVPPLTFSALPAVLCHTMLFATDPSAVPPPSLPATVQFRSVP